MRAAATPRSISPPFTEEHEALRDSIRRFVEKELRPHVAEWEEARWFPNEVFTRMAELGLLGLKYPEEYGGQGGDYLHDAVLTEELARCGSGGLAAGIGAHIGIATPPIWKFGTDDQKRRFLAPGDRGREDRRARHHRARRRLRRGRPAHQSAQGRWRLHRERLEDLHHKRRARRLRGHRGEDHGGGRPPRPLVPASRARHGGLHRVAQARQARLARLRHRRARLRRRVRARGEPARRGEQGLLPDHGQLPVGAAADGARRGRRRCRPRSSGRSQYAQEREAFGRPIGRHQAIRHKIAEMAVEVETGRALTYHALRLFAAGQDAIRR